MARSPIMRLAILTKAPSKTGGRNVSYKAICGDEFAFAPDVASNSEALNHTIAARSLATKLGWHGLYVGAAQAFGGGCFFIRVGSAHSDFTRDGLFALPSKRSQQPGTSQSHTPEPWHIGEHVLMAGDQYETRGLYIAAGSETVCDLYEHTGAALMPFDDAEANAHLFLAAPAMLSILRRILSCAPAAGHLESAGGIYSEAQSVVDAAEGRA